MKCPKCGYISFDYNQRCPKCNKDLGPEQKRRNLVAFKHNPPFFLGSLTGDLNEIDVPPDADMAEEIEDLEGQDLDMHLDMEGSVETGTPVEDVALDLGDLSGAMAQSDEKIVEFFEEPDQGEALDLSDLSLTEEPVEMQASHGVEPQDESEMVTTEIDKKKPHTSEDHNDIDLELD
jgi:hypothetical protein